MQMLVDIGPGYRSNGSAQIFGSAGFKVYINDGSADELKHALSNIEGNFKRIISKDKMSPEEMAFAFRRTSCASSIDRIGRLRYCNRSSYRKRRSNATDIQFSK